MVFLASWEAISDQHDRAEQAAESRDERTIGNESGRPLVTERQAYPIYRRSVGQDQEWSSLFLLGFATAFQYLQRPSSVRGTGK